MVPEVTYLGISPSQAGVSGTKLLDRVKKRKRSQYINCEIGNVQERAECWKMY